MLDSTAITKIQSIILIAVIVVAAVGGVAAYVSLSGEEQPSETIKIGVCIDLDKTYFHGGIWWGAVLAAEQVNAEGGVLGRNFTVVAEDDDSYTPDFNSNIAINAMTRLITVDEADFVISSNVLPSSTIYQEIAAEHKKILFILTDADEELTQRVLDDYDRYKYYFRAGTVNETTTVKNAVDSLILCREYTGFNKIAFIYQSPMFPVVSSAIDVLGDYGFDVVLDETLSADIDYSSCFAKAEAAGAEILVPSIIGPKQIPFVKEYYDRQSPMIMWGIVGGGNTFWEETGGKCDYISSAAHPIVSGYPFTSKTVPTRNAYFERWDEQINLIAAAAYDIVRFILPDAIERAGTIETEAVIKALEETDVETSLARRFVFTSSHDIMLDLENPDFMLQWQDGVQVPVYPKKIMEEAGATFMYPDWPGPWD